MESLTSISGVSKMVTMCHLPPASFTFRKCGLVHCLLGGTWRCSYFALPISRGRNLHAYDKLISLLADTNSTLRSCLNWPRCDRFYTKAIRWLSRAFLAYLAP